MLELSLMKRNLLLDDHTFFLNGKKGMGNSVGIIKRGIFFVRILGGENHGKECIYDAAMGKSGAKLILL